MRLTQASGRLRSRIRLSARKSQSPWLTSIRSSDSMLRSFEWTLFSFSFYHTCYGLDEEGVLRRYCVFCNIVAGTEPARIHYQDDDIIVFDNRLRWAPVMILIMPKQHMTQ